uniref:m-AAA protease-interacting protein 1, mitochondrial-like n=1 Tax=Oncorhynchus gorbuscha TaxID=8017 RepID=UPI001EAEDD30|nr:m-AAA protease-interacting protein 1, mitochondrial-like [Oncorhynchus gorbuscha]
MKIIKDLSHLSHGLFTTLSSRRRGRKFCFIVMRFWHMSTADVPEDQESTKIFKMATTEEDGPQKKIVTAVYEFHWELTKGAEPDWTVTNIWHWKLIG